MPGGCVGPRDTTKVSSGIALTAALPDVVRKPHVSRCHPNVVVPRQVQSGSQLLTGLAVY